jgi:hypothetical protein
VALKTAVISISSSSRSSSSSSSSKITFNDTSLCDSMHMHIQSSITAALCSFFRLQMPRTEIPVYYILFLAMVYCLLFEVEVWDYTVFEIP